MGIHLTDNRASWISHLTAIQFISYMPPFLHVPSCYGTINIYLAGLFWRLCEQGFVKSLSKGVSPTWDNIHVNVFQERVILLFWLYLFINDGINYWIQRANTTWTITEEHLWWICVMFRNILQRHMRYHQQKQQSQHLSRTDCVSWRASQCFS